ncbi:MAG: hypothetical protein CL537_09555 [Alcanivoracaceae bacterium]|nr:hypothetical protein [Alcanivoracaceae bacterium]
MKIPEFGRQGQGNRMVAHVRQRITQTLNHIHIYFQATIFNSLIPLATQKRVASTSRYCEY